MNTRVTTLRNARLRRSHGCSPRSQRWFGSFRAGAVIAPGSDPAFYDTLVELFEAVMGTFRWAYA